MADLSNILHAYLAHRHWDLRTTDVNDRWEKLKKDGLFTGHMKEWDKRYYDDTGNAVPIQTLGTTISGPTADDDWKALYYACQKTFQEMDSNKVNEVGYGSPYNGPTKDFVAKWFGSEVGKLFTVSTATPGVDAFFVRLKDWLKANKNNLETPFLKDYKNEIFTDDYTYDKFVEDIENKRYNTDSVWRKKLERFVPNTEYYQNNPDPEHLPGGLPVLDFTGMPSNKPDEWYEISNETTRIKWFKTEYVQIFDKLLTNKTIREKFLEKAPYLVREALKSAIADTDYENKDSDDYVKPDPVDEKNFIQKMKKWKNDTYENHFRRFFDHNRGARKFYSPMSQNIMKALDKAGVKPIEGIDGIIAKKDDAKLKGVITNDKFTEKHFDWFVKTMGTIKEQIPDAYEGALRNGHQLRQVVAYVITTAMKDGEVAKAKTALEVLSVAKYGLSMSRTFDRLKETTKSMKLVNDSEYSWMKKGTATEFIANAANSAIGAGIRLAGRIGTMSYNFIQHRRTKFNRNIKDNKHLKNEHKLWEDEDTKKRSEQVNDNVAHEVSTTLTDLNSTGRTVGPKYKTTGFQINETTMGTEDAPGPLRTAIDAAVSTGATDVNVPGYGSVPLADIQEDVKIYEDAYDRNKLEHNDDYWREKNPDVMHDLMAYWDMLETYTMSHTFALGSMKLKREMFLENYKDKTSQAQQTADMFIQNYGNLRAA